jgi:hypothetical protein
MAPPTGRVIAADPRSVCLLAYGMRIFPEHEAMELQPDSLCRNQMLWKTFGLAILALGRGPALVGPPSAASHRFCCVSSLAGEGKPLR